MKAKKLKGTVSISKMNSGMIAITIEDVASGIDFVRIEMKPSEFANAVTGRHGRPGIMEIQGLRQVGCKKEVERATCKLTKRLMTKLKISPYSKEQLEQYLVEFKQRAGWSLNPYLGSQSSVDYDGDTVILNFSYIRYVRT